MGIVKMFYDVETTGTNYKQHSIIQLSGMFEVDGEVKETFDFNVRPHPNAKIEDAALEINKKTREEIMLYPKMSSVHKTLTNMLSRYVDKYDNSQKIHNIGFNNRAFDDFFLRMFFELNGDRFIGSWFWVDTIDVMCLASEYLINRRKQMPSFKLKRVATELGIVVDKTKLHDSMYDVELTRKIYRIVTGKEIEI